MRARESDPYEYNGENPRDSTMPLMEESQGSDRNLDLSADARRFTGVARENATLGVILTRVDSTNYIVSRRTTE